MADVVPLRGDAAVAAGQVEPTVVETLERWLERAKSGEVVALGIVGVAPNGAVGTEFRNPSVYLHHLISGASTMAYRLHAESNLK